MSFLQPRVMSPPPPPPPAPPHPPDVGRARVVAEEAAKTERQRRRGRGSTIVAGALGETIENPSGPPTLMS